jgi:hypothetical protein
MQRPWPLANDLEYQPLMEVSGISADFKTPVRCPKCQKLLTIVQIQVTKVLEWTVDENDKEDEGRFEDNGQGATEVFCYHCSTKIGHYDANDEWGLFPDSTFADF